MRFEKFFCSSSDEASFLQREPVALIFSYCHFLVCYVSISLLFQISVLENNPWNKPYDRLKPFWFYDNVTLPVPGPARNPVCYYSFSTVILKKIGFSIVRIVTTFSLLIPWFCHSLNSLLYADNLAQEHSFIVTCCMISMLLPFIFRNESMNVGKILLSHHLQGTQNLVEQRKGFSIAHFSGQVTPNFN